MDTVAEGSKVTLCSIASVLDALYSVAALASVEGTYYHDSGMPSD